MDNGTKEKKRVMESKQTFGEGLNNKAIHSLFIWSKGNMTVMSIKEPLSTICFMGKENIARKHQTTCMKDNILKAFR